MLGKNVGTYLQFWSLCWYWYEWIGIWRPPLNHTLSPCKSQDKISSSKPRPSFDDGWSIVGRQKKSMKSKSNHYVVVCLCTHHIHTHALSVLLAETFTVHSSTAYFALLLISLLDEPLLLALAKEHIKGRIRLNVHECACERFSSEYMR